MQMVSGHFASACCNSACQERFVLDGCTTHVTIRYLLHEVDKAINYVEVFDVRIL